MYLRYFATLDNGESCQRLCKWQDKCKDIYTARIRIYILSSI